MNKLKHCVFLGCLGFLTFLLTNEEQALAQEDFYQSVAREVTPGGYLSSMTGDILDFDNNQKKTAAKLRKEYGEWTRSKERDALLQKRDFNSLFSKRMEFFNELNNSLSPIQQKHLHKMIAARYSRNEARNYLIKNKLLHEKMNDIPIWLAPRISKIIALDQNQKNQIDALIGDLLTEFQNSEKKQKSSSATIFKNWNNDLYACLTKKQQKQFKDSIGSPVKFSDEVEGFCQFGYIVGKLPLFVGKKPVEPIVEYSNPNAPLTTYLLLIQSGFSKPYEINGLLGILLEKSIKKELELSEDQVSEIKEIEKDWRKTHPKKTKFSVKSSYGLEPARKNKKTELPKGYQKTLKKIQQALNATQKKRIRQIWHQIVINTGWKEVPLAHPDWQRHLKLSLKQKDQFMVIHKKYQSLHNKWEAEKKSAERRENASLSDLCDEILDPDQLDKLEDLFGPYRDPNYRLKIR